MAWQYRWNLSEPIALVPLGPASILSRTAGVSSGLGDASGDATVGILTIVWALGSAISLVVFAVGCARLAWLGSRSATLREGPWREAADMLCQRFCLTRRIEIVESRHPALLVTWGWLRPRILLPAGARDWPVERIWIVLAHEFAHIRRRDWLVQIAAEILRSIYWFNPIVWIACRTLRRQSELACDDVVLGQGVEGSAYATQLLEIARGFKRARRFIDSSLAAPAMARPSSFERRVRAMLTTDRNRTPVSRVVGICTVLALLAITLPVAGLLASASSQGGAAATFSGSVMDAVGRVIPNLTLLITSKQSRATRETTSDASGHFAFTDLAPGEYVIEVRKPGFDPVQGRVRIDPGEALEQDVALQVGSIQETITVTPGEAVLPPPPPPPPSGAVDRGMPPPPPPTPPAKAQERTIGDSCNQSLVGGCIQPPIKLTNVLPRYPPRQRDAAIGGTVKVEGRIGTDGYLKELRLAAPAEPEFVRATLNALSGWKFAPTRLGAVPVETRINVTVSFASR